MDGYDDSQNSSRVGYETNPFAEQTVARTGQSMPFFYSGAPNSDTAEATRTFDPPQDWTRAGIQRLRVCFFGDPDNAPGFFFVKINGAKVVCGASDGIQLDQWNEWDIDLAAVATDLQQVQTLSIGVDSGGADALFIDDIVLR